MNADIPTHGYTGIDNTEDLYNACAALASAELDAEWELIAAILASPTMGWSIAHEAGVVTNDLDRDDLRLIFAGCEVAAELAMDSTATLILIRRALQADKFWDASQIAGNVGQMYWSNESLVAACHLYPFSPSIINQHAGTLLKLRRRLALATDAYRQLERVLTSDIGDLDHETNQTRPIRQTA